MEALADRARAAGVEALTLVPTLDDFNEDLRRLGVEAFSVDRNGCPPVMVRGGGLRGGACRIKGTMSSQYLSALLMAAHPLVSE